jgi:hypothetical protein
MHNNDNPSWDEDKVNENFQEAHKQLREAQQKHRENHDANVQKALMEQEEKAKEADDKKAATKAAAAVEAIIQKHRTQESYTQIRNVIKPNSGGCLQ